MAFINKNNSVSLKGFVQSELNILDEQKRMLSFFVKVYRPADNGKQASDSFEVRVFDNQNYSIAVKNLRKGMSVKVKGELRTWVDGSIKICASKLEPIYG